MTDDHNAVTGLYYYPVKSLSGIRLEEAELTPFGILNDRMWMLTGESGRFITQREEHRLALLKVTADDAGFVIRAPDGSSTFLPVTAKSGDPVRVSVWRDELDATSGPDDAARFFSEYLGYRCVPVFMPENAG
ncbi:MAG TPA: MOSC domain-containing protein, partial [Rhodothermia bacterium]